MNGSDGRLRFNSDGWPGAHQRELFHLLSFKLTVYSAVIEQGIKPLSWLAIDLGRRIM
jgi:hypothetical protein